MPINIVDVDAWTTPVQSQAAGEGVNQVNELIPHQALANRTRYIRERCLTAIGGEIDIPMCEIEQVNFLWQGMGAFGGATIGWRQQGGGTAADRVVIPIPGMIPGTSITGLRARIETPAWAGAAVPSRLELYVVTDAAGATVSTLLGGQDDAGPAAHHDIVLAVAPAVCGPGRTYYALLRGESGAGASPVTTLIRMAVAVSPA